MIYSIRMILCLLVGLFVGHWLHEDPSWDIGKDDRGCLIQWDDGTSAYKSRVYRIGDLAPGESKTLKVQSFSSWDVTTHPVRVADIEGFLTPYDFIFESNPDCSEILCFKYIGSGKIYSINGVEQGGEEVFRFYTKVLK